MRKLFSAALICALAVALTAAPAGVAKKGQKGPKGPKLVPGAVSALVVPNPVPATALTVTASGNMFATSGCRKDRTVRFAWVNSTTGAVTPLVQTTETGPNGDYTVTLPRPADTPPATVVLRVTVDQEFRKVGSKKRKKGKKPKKGRQFNCLDATGQSSAVTLAEAAA